MIKQLQSKIAELQGKIDHLTTVSRTLDQIEPFYRMLADSVPGIVYRVLPRKNNEMIFYNDRLEELTGFEPNELTGGEVYQLDCLVVKEDRLRVISELRQAIRENRRFEIEYKIRRKDGSLRVFRERGHPILGKDDELLYIDGVILDITDKRQTQDMLRQTIHFNDAVISNIEEGIVVYDRQMCHRAWNHFMEKLTGMKEESVLGRNALELFPHLKKNGIDQLILRAFEGEVAPSMPFEYHEGSSGRAGWIEGTYVPYRDAEGKVIAVIGVVHEITKRMTDALALKDSKEYLERIIDAMADALFVKNSQHRYVMVNEAFCRMLGRSRQDILDKQDKDFFTAEQAQSFVYKDEQVFSGAGSDLSEDTVAAVTPGGSPRTIVTDRSLYTDSAGRRFIVGTIRDISERKQIEVKLRQKMEDLEQINRFMVDRELKMIELKETIGRLNDVVGSVKSPFEEGRAS